MNIKEVIVPPDVQYISQWKDYKFPIGHCIVDKGITGCGYTEFCLRNEKDVILCSPRKLLLENKADQHKDDDNILYLENDIVDLSSKERFDLRISEHIVKCRVNGKAIKFLITYDSTHYLINKLKELNQLDNFYLIVDEFQVIFFDSFFKVEVENSFLDNIQQCKNIIYLSATPLQNEYLSYIDEFNSLDFYSLKWDNSPYVSKLVINRKHVSSLGTEAGNIIRKFLEGDFPVIVEDCGKITKSTEAVLYFNSVNEISKLLKKNNLQPNQVNILCANTADNQAKLKKLGHEVGKIPVKGEPNKMFTLCTSTCYVGSDFYSDCASTYIFADPNLEHLALDISLDLPQIAGRQRNIENPFKNIINLFYKTTRKDMIIDEVDFRNLQELRKRRTFELLKMYNSSTEAGKEAMRSRMVFQNKEYVVDFLSLSEREGVTYNKLIEISNERAFRIQQKDYQDDINVTRVISEVISDVEINNYRSEFDQIIDKFLTTEFFTTGVFDIKLKYFCEFMDKYRDNSYIRESLRYKIPDLRYHNYYLLFGTAKCKALNWKDAKLKRELDNILNKDKIKLLIYKEFKPGDRYTKKYVKQILKTLYGISGISSTPKATDLSNYFELKKVSIIDPVTKTKDNGFEITNKK